MSIRTALVLAISLVLTAACWSAEDASAPGAAPFPYVWAKGYHVLPETHNNESGYFALAEGIDGKIYIGATRYGENSYLVEFDPKTEQQRIVIDTQAVTGDKGKGYASQAKIHTKCFVGPSGKVYCGSMQGYPSQEEVKANDVAPYAGGYVMVYDPKADKAASLGIPYPGEGVIDVVADEARDRLYAITIDGGHWMTSDLAGSRWRWLGPQCATFASTLVDAQGRANVITRDFRLARWDPASNALSVQPIVVDGKPLQLPAEADARSGWGPYWELAADGKTAYMIRMSHPELFKLDFGGPMDQPVQATMVGRMTEAPGPDCRSGIDVGPDGKVYALIAVTNTTGFGEGQLNHLISYNPADGKMQDHGVLAVKNPEFHAKAIAGPDGKPKPHTYGYQTLPDGTLTPKFQHLGAIVTRDGGVCAVILYPLTLMRVDPVSGVGGSGEAQAAR